MSHGNILSASIPRGPAFTASQCVDHESRNNIRNVLASPHVKAAPLLHSDNTGEPKCCGASTKQWLNAAIGNSR